jgi:prepilin-type N-terminal cleavage/methylation domain-containing protein
MVKNNSGVGKGFTLAEALIALTIVGVIAALVIPELLNSINETEYNVGVKKAYSELIYALDMLQNTGATVHVGTAPNMGDAPSSNVFRNDFCNVMSCVKIGTGYNILSPTVYKYYKGGSIGWPDAGEIAGAALLNNGQLIRFFSYDNCNYYGVNACGDIHIDINGKKGPNMVGKDLYFFYITYKNGVYSVIPGGALGDTRNTLTDGCTSGSNSWATSCGCTTQRLMGPDNMP